LGEWSFSTWKRKLAKQSATGVTFVPAIIANRSSELGGPWTAAALTLVLNGRYRLEVEEGFCAKTLSRLLAVLENDDVFSR